MRARWHKVADLGIGCAAVSTSSGRRYGQAALARDSEVLILAVAVLDEQQAARGGLVGTALIDSRLEEKTERSPFRRQSHLVPGTGCRLFDEDRLYGMHASSRTAAVKVAGVLCQTGGTAHSPLSTDACKRAPPAARATLGAFGRWILQRPSLREQHRRVSTEPSHALQTDLATVVQDVDLAIGHEVTSRAQHRRGCHVPTAKEQWV